MSPLRQPPEPPPVDVREVGDRPVPFLRSLEWVATALRAFREKPLPSTYSTEVQPTVDLFGSHRVAEIQFEEVLGLLGAVEALGPKVDAGKYRYVLSMAFMHDDGVRHIMQPLRVISVGGTFPQAPMESPPESFAGPSASGNVWYVARNFTVPPEGRAGAMIDAIGAAARMTLRSLFVELDVGETVSTIR